MNDIKILRIWRGGSRNDQVTKAKAQVGAGTILAINCYLLTTKSNWISIYYCLGPITKHICEFKPEIV